MDPEGPLTNEEAEDEIPIAGLVVCKKKPAVAMAATMAVPKAATKGGKGKAQKGGKGEDNKAGKGEENKGGKCSKGEVATKGGKGKGVQQDGEAEKLLVLLISWFSYAWVMLHVDS